MRTRAKKLQHKTPKAAKQSKLILKILFAYQANYTKITTTFTSFISEDEINEIDFHNVFDPTGYRIEDIKKIEVAKKGLFYKEI